MYLSHYAALDFGVYFGDSSFFQSFNESDNRRNEVKRVTLALLGEPTVGLIPEVHDPAAPDDFNVPYATFNPFGKGVRIIIRSGALIDAMPAAVDAAVNDPRFVEENFSGDLAKNKTRFESYKDQMRIDRVTIDIFSHGVGSIAFHIELPDQAVDLLDCVGQAIDDVFIRQSSGMPANSIKTFKAEIRKLLWTREAERLFQGLGNRAPSPDKSASKRTATIAYAPDTVDSFSGVAVTNNTEHFDKFVEHPGYLKITTYDGDHGKVAAGWWITVAKFDGPELNYKFDYDRLFYIKKTFDVMWWLSRVFERYLSMESENQFKQSLNKKSNRDEIHNLRYLSLLVIANIQVDAISYAQNDLQLFRILEVDGAIAARSQRISFIAESLSQLAAAESDNQEADFQSQATRWGLALAAASVLGVIVAVLAFFQEMRAVADLRPDYWTREWILPDHMVVIATAIVVLIVIIALAFLLSSALSRGARARTYFIVLLLFAIVAYLGVSNSQVVGNIFSAVKVRP